MVVTPQEILLCTGKKEIVISTLKQEHSHHKVTQPQSTVLKVLTTHFYNFFCGQKLAALTKRNIKFNCGQTMATASEEEKETRNAQALYVIRFQALETANYHFSAFSRPTFTDFRPPFSM